MHKTNEQQSQSWSASSPINGIAWGCTSPDRGDASLAWLALAEALHVKLVIRWIKSHLFLDAMGQAKKFWQSGQHKK